MVDKIAGCEIEGVIHESERAVVYRGTRAGQRVAIKHRKQAAAQVREQPPAHRTPGRPHVYHVAFDDRGRRITVMELLEGHNIVEELQSRMAIDLARVRTIMEALCATLTERHPALRTDQIFMKHGNEPVILGFDAPFPPLAPLIVDAYTAPEQLTNPAVTLQTCAYAAGVILYELVAGVVPFASPMEAMALANRLPSIAARRPGASSAEDLVTRLVRIAPSERADVLDLGGSLCHLKGTAYGMKRGYRANDSHESTLLDALRSDPKDVATRQVYADWLEQHGFDLRAAHLRTEDRFDDGRTDDSLETVSGAPADDAAWRAVVSREGIAVCPNSPLTATGIGEERVAFQFKCPRRWDALRPTAFDDVRYCGECQKPVFFVTSVDEARTRGERSECIAIDTSLAASTAMMQYNTGASPPLPPDFYEQHVTMGMVMYAPPERRPSVLSRLFGWIRR